MGKLEQKVIVITGGTRGVGRVVSYAFAREGAKVVMGDLDDTTAQPILDGVRAFGGEAMFVQCDVRSPENCKRLFDTAYEAYGKIDGHFNYAGITPVSPLDTCDEETFDAVMDTDFKGSFFCCQNAIRYMRKNGGGSIVLTGSPHAWCGDIDRTAYACAKGAVYTLSEHIAHQYAREHIRCNYLVPGWTATDGEIELRRTQGMTEAQMRAWADPQIPMGRMCEATDYTDALIFLFSDAAWATTGSILRMAGGLYL